MNKIWNPSLHIVLFFTNPQKVAFRSWSVHFQFLWTKHEIHFFTLFSSSQVLKRLHWQSWSVLQFLWTKYETHFFTLFSSSQILARLLFSMNDLCIPVGVCKIWNQFLHMVLFFTNSCKVDFRSWPLHSRIFEEIFTFPSHWSLRELYWLGSNKFKHWTKTRRSSTWCVVEFELQDLVIVKQCCVIWSPSDVEILCESLEYLVMFPCFLRFWNLDRDDNDEK